MFGRQSLDGRHDEPRGGVGLDPAPADHLALDPAAGKAAEVVQRGGQVPRKPVQMVDDDRVCSGHFHSLGQALEAFPISPAHAVVREDLGEGPAPFGAIGRNPGPLVLEAHGPLGRLLAASDVADGRHE